MAKRSYSWMAITYKEPTEAAIAATAPYGHLAIARHDQDLTEDEEPKKVHWHILLKCPSLKSQEQARKMLAELQPANNVVMPPTDYHAALRYLLHLDHPDKAQYTENNLTANWAALKEMQRDKMKKDKSDEASLITRYVALIKALDTIFFSDLVDAILESEDEELIGNLPKFTPFLSSYLRSLEYITRVSNIV